MKWRELQCIIGKNNRTKLSKKKEKEQVEAVEKEEVETTKVANDKARLIFMF